MAVLAEEGEVARLQRQVDDQSGQLKTIMALIQTTVTERAAITAERAAIRAIETIRSLREEPPSDDNS